MGVHAAANGNDRCHGKDQSAGERETRMTDDADGSILAHHLLWSITRFGPWPARNPESATVLPAIYGFFSNHWWLAALLEIRSAARYGAGYRRRLAKCKLG